MHVFAPALPLIATDFSATAADSQYTISLYVVSLAVGQLFYGPLSDRFGRRPVLLSGLSLFVLAGAMAAIAPSLLFLVIARILQGLGGCAGLVLARAIVQDMAAGPAGARTIATLNIAQLSASAIAPVVGFWIALHGHWRAVPMMLCLIGLVALAGAIWRLDETGRNLPGSNGWKPYALVFRAKGFLTNLMVGAFTTTSLFNLLATMPFVVSENLDRPESEIGYYYLVLVGGVMSGGFLSRCMADKVALERVILITTLFGMACGILLLTLFMTNQLGIISYITLGYLFTLTCGVMGVAALAQTTANVGQLKGTAVGLYGFTQMTTGAIVIVLGSMGPDILFSSSLTLAGCACIGFAIHLADRMLS